MKLGTLTPTFRLGSVTPSRIYLGANLVWENFTPLSLSPALWLSDTGTNPAQWDDLSGNGRHATQPNPSNRPAIVTGEKNGRQVRRFAKSNSTRLVFGVSFSARTIIAVVKNTNTAGQILCDFASPGQGPNDAGFGWAQGNIVKTGSASWNPAGQYTFADTARVNDVPVANSGLGLWLVLTGERSRPAHAFRAESVNVGYGLSAFDHMDGDIAEILVFPTALSTADRQAVETYLNAKWAIY